MLAEFEREGLGRVDDRYFGGLYFNFAGGHVFIGVGAGPQCDFACDAQDIFAFGFFGGFEDGAIGPGYYLGDAVEVAQVYEEDAAVIAFYMVPAAEGYCLAGVAGVELAAGVGAERGFF